MFKSCASVAHHSTPVYRNSYTDPDLLGAGLFDEWHCGFLFSGGINTAVRCVAVSSVLRSPVTNVVSMATKPTERAAACVNAEVSGSCDHVIELLTVNFNVKLHNPFNKLVI